MADVDAVVIGAGAVGLAIARRLAQQGLMTLIIEGEAAIGSGISSRNSEVIHAGLYYGTTPLKQRLCIAGRERLYRYAQLRKVPHRRIGKLIVAFTTDDLAALDRIQTDARAAGVGDLIALSGQEAKRLEPALDCVGALLSPSTGIIDSHGYMQALLADAEASGAILARLARVSHIRRRGGAWQVCVGGDAMLTTDLVVNAAGLGAVDLALATEGLAATHIPTLRYARGNYFAYQGKVPFRRLIYPVPVPGGLGTHLTLDLAGGGRFGPDVEWIEDVDFTVSADRRDSFCRAAQRIWPLLDPERVVPAYAGIRPKLSGPGEPAADFVVQGPASHGLSGLVNLFGIESPGLTASLAIAEHAASLLALSDDVRACA